MIKYEGDALDVTKEMIKIDGDALIDQLCPM